MPGFLGGHAAPSGSNPGRHSLSGISCKLDNYMPIKAILPASADALSLYVCSPQCCCCGGSQLCELLLGRIQLEVHGWYMKRVWPGGHCGHAPCNQSSMQGVLGSAIQAVCLACVHALPADCSDNPATQPDNAVLWDCAEQDRKWRGMHHCLQPWLHRHRLHIHLYPWQLGPNQWRTVPGQKYVIISDALFAAFCGLWPWSCH